MNVKPATIRLGIIVFCSISLFSQPTSAQNWDLDLAKSINPRDPSSGYWRTISYSAYALGAGIPIALLIIEVPRKDSVSRARALRLFGTSLAELVISESVKYAVNRQRPGDRYPGIIFPYSPTHGYSFPSGHTSLAFSIAAGLGSAYGKWYITVPAYVWASMVGYSRVYFGVHYPSDVLAGAAIGIGSLYVSKWLNRTLFHEKHIRDGVD